VKEMNKIIISADEDEKYVRFNLNEAAEKTEHR
jgi:hypothetical protein